MDQLIEKASNPADIAARMAADKLDLIAGGKSPMKIKALAALLKISMEAAEYSALLWNWNESQDTFSKTVGQQAGDDVMRQPESRFGRIPGGMHYQSAGGLKDYSG